MQIIGVRFTKKIQNWENFAFLWSWFCISAKMVFACLSPITPWDAELAHEANLTFKTRRNTVNQLYLNDIFWPIVRPVTANETQNIIKWSPVCRSFELKPSF